MPSALANRRRAIAACSQKLKSSTEKYIYARGLLMKRMFDLRNMALHSCTKRRAWHWTPLRLCGYRLA